MPYIKINDIKFYYEIQGEDEPLLFIHGLGGSTLDWEYQVPFFAKYFQVITLDLRGHGKTEKPAQPYSVTLFANDVAELIRSLHLNPVHVVGHSLGGMIAFQLALDFPDLIKSLTIINSGPEFKFPNLKMALYFYLRRVNVWLFGMRKLSGTLAKGLFPKPEQEQIRQKFGKRCRANDPKAYRNSLRVFSGWSVINRLANLHCKTLIITADHDYTPVAYKAFYTKLIPNAQLIVIQDSYHFSIADQPKQFNEALFSFLRKIK